MCPERTWDDIYKREGTTHRRTPIDNLLGTLRRPVCLIVSTNVTTFRLIMNNKSLLGLHQEGHKLSAVCKSLMNSAGTLSMCDLDVESMKSISTPEYQ